MLLKVYGYLWKCTIVHHSLVMAKHKLNNNKYIITREPSIVK